MMSIPPPVIDGRPSASARPAGQLTVKPGGLLPGTPATHTPPCWTQALVAASGVAVSGPSGADSSDASVEPSDAGRTAVLSVASEPHAAAMTQNRTQASPRRRSRWSMSEC